MRTAMTKLTVALRNFTNASKNASCKRGGGGTMPSISSIHSFKIRRYGNTTAGYPQYPGIYISVYLPTFRSNLSAASSS